MWNTLGDKCATHQLYSLAADFYSVGISYDPDAFKKPKLWYTFAKACYKCGRIMDAQLSVKVRKKNMIHGDSDSSSSSSSNGVVVVFIGLYAV